MTQITLRGHNDHLPRIRKIRQKVTVSHILILIARHNNAVGAFHLINGLTDSGSVGTDSDHIMPVPHQKVADINAILLARKDNDNINHSFPPPLMIHQEGEKFKFCTDTGQSPSL